MGFTDSGTHGTGMLDGMPTNGQVNVFSPSQQPAFHAGGDSDNSFGQSPHPGKLVSQVCFAYCEIKLLSAQHCLPNASRH